MNHPLTFGKNCIQGQISQHDEDDRQYPTDKYGSNAFPHSILLDEANFDPE
ncbi:hypothetical protein KFU94_70150 [Chloroflexi bacterium TSY]|nr:hypothetical protein [Chloroflexi bacterium TSY]